MTASDAKNRIDSRDTDNVFPVALSGSRNQASGFAGGSVTLCNRYRHGSYNDMM